jgi:anaerobic selenocysteine-containing dehydrogenase
MREALRALDFSVVIDVAMTETAREADYVLPAASQFEKAEATFFNFEFPRNAFHIRKPLFEPLPGTLTEAEIHARLLEQMGELSERDYKPLRMAAKLGLTPFAAAFASAVAVKPKLMKYVGVVLYRTLGQTLPKGMETAAVVWGMCLQFVKTNPDAAKRAGFGGPAPMAANKLFKQLVEGPSAVVFAESVYEESRQNVAMPDHRIQLHVPEMLEELKEIADEPLTGSSDYPFVLSAGERRSETTNTVIRDASWHAKGEFAPLRICPSDAGELDCESGDLVRLSTERATAEVTLEVSEMMQPGHISLPNGTGLSYVADDGQVIRKGLAPNEFTDTRRRDLLAGTPWHKNVPAKLERITTPGKRAADTSQKVGAAK